MQFDLQAPYKPTGDQPQAIADLVKGVRQAIAIRFTRRDRHGQDFYRGERYPAVTTANPGDDA